MVSRLFRSVLVAALCAIGPAVAGPFTVGGADVAYDVVGPSLYEVDLNPRQTYLRWNTAANCQSNDPICIDAALPPLVIDLAALGYTPGTVIHLQRLGDYTLTDPAFAPDPFAADDFTNLGAVFSTSGTLLDLDDVAVSDAAPNRIPGAIPVWEAAFNDDPALGNNATPITYTANLIANIPFDFFVGDTFITVPTGARYLFVGVPDNYYADNFDPDGDFGLRIGIPEPGTAAILVLAAGLLAARRRP